MKLATEKKIAELETEIDNLEKTRKHYKMQSEWLRMMYERVLKLETLKKLIDGDNG